MPSTIWRRPNGCWVRGQPTYTISNPWPKAAHLQRRVHGHASFPLLLRLGGSLELRSNWQLYVEEFSCAMHLAGQRGRVATVSDSDPAISLFEQKYRDSGHLLWAYTTRILQ